MKKRLFILPILWAMATSVSADSSLTQQADAAWAQRADPGQTQKAYSLWAEALKENPSQSALWISLTRAGARITRHTDDKTEKQHWADRTRELAEKAVQKNPQSSEAYGYLGEALGQWADAHKGLGSLKAVSHAVEALKKAVALDPKNSHAHMLLSEFYRQAPSHISVGDKEKAFTEAKRAVETGPQYAINHLALAEIQNDRGEKTAAIEELQATLALSPPPDAIPETKSDQDTARELLKKLGGSPIAEPAPAVGACSASENSSGSCQSKTP